MKHLLPLLLVSILVACSTPKPAAPSLTPVVSPSLIPSGTPSPIPSARSAIVLMTRHNQPNEIYRWLLDVSKWQLLTGLSPVITTSALADDDTLFIGTKTGQV